MIATASNSAAVHPLLRQLHVFEEAVNVLPPNNEARKEVNGAVIDSELAYPYLYSKDTASFRRTKGASFRSHQR